MGIPKWQEHATPKPKYSLAGPGATIPEYDPTTVVFRFMGGHTDKRR